MAARSDADFEQGAKARCPHCRRLTRWLEPGCGHVCFIWEPERGYVNLDVEFQKLASDRLKELEVAGDEFPTLVEAWSDLGRYAKKVSRIFPELTVVERSYEAPAGHGSWFVAFGFSKGLLKSAGAKAIRAVKAEDKRNAASASKEARLLDALGNAPRAEVLRMLGRRPAGTRVNGSRTALMLAADAGREDLIPALLRKGGKPLFMNEKEESAASIAIERHSWRVLRAMLTRAVVRSASLAEARQLWEAAVRSGDLKAAALLIDSGLGVERVDIADREWTIVEDAVRAGSLAYVQRLMSLGAIGNSSSLWFAVQVHRPDIVDALIQDPGDWSKLLIGETVRGFFLYKSIDCLEVALKREMPLGWRDYRGRSALELILEEVASPYTLVDKARVVNLLARWGSGIRSLGTEERETLSARLDTLESLPGVAEALTALRSRLSAEG